MLQDKIFCRFKYYKNPKSKRYTLKNSNSHRDVIILAQIKNEKTETLCRSGLLGLQVHMIHKLSKPERDNRLNNIPGFKTY